MCEFCDLMPNEGSDGLINRQTFGFFSPAAIEEAVGKAHHERNKNINETETKPHEDDKPRPSKDGGGDNGEESGDQGYDSDGF